MSADNISFPKVLIHVGRPDFSKPHRDLSVIQLFANANPDTALIIIVDTDEDWKAMEEAVQAQLKWPKGHPGGLILCWKDDGELIDLLCSKMFGTLSWRVVGNGWYQCANGHEISPTMTEPLEKCTQCDAPKPDFIRLNEARVSQFKEILVKAASLMHFDTRSGVVLKQLVSPEANVLRNAAEIIGCKHQKALCLEDFYQKGKGKTALCISAGPSLDDEIANIKRLQERCLILCVGRVYKRLRAAGIRVDYTFSCEMFDWDNAIFEGLEDVDDTILCYPNVCAPTTVQAWPGRKLCMLDAQMAQMLGRKLCMMGGNSVSHHMLNFACEILDVDEAILVGQDLAYTKPGMTHASQSAPDGWPDEVKAQDSAAHAEITWAPSYGKGGRFHPECHRSKVAVGHAGFAPLEPIEVLTSKPYQNFAVLFEILVSRHKKRVLNACGEGLKIAGVPYVNLSEVQ